MTVNAMAEGKLTYVFKKGIISAPEFGAVTTNTSCYKQNGGGSLTLSTIHMK